MSMKMRFGLFALVGLLLLTGMGEARADCTSPAGVEGKIIYNSDHKVAQFCNGTDWIGMAGGSTSIMTGDTMTDGWPDAITCSDEGVFYSGYSSGVVKYYFSPITTPNGGDTTSTDVRQRWLSFNISDKTWNANGHATSLDDSCVGKSISQLYADGQAFNFVGGGSGGSGSGGGSDTLAGLSCTDGQVAAWNNGNSSWECSDAPAAGGGSVDASGMIVAFEASSCPTGWTEYTPARGRFLRGLDPDGTTDADGLRIAGSTQEDAFQGHRHAMQFSTATPVEAWTVDYNVGATFGRGANGGGSNYGTMRIADPIADLVNGTPRISSETRPKNVAVIFCEYTGSGGLGGGGSGSGGGATDRIVDANGDTYIDVDSDGSGNTDYIDLHTGATLTVYTDNNDDPTLESSTDVISILDHLQLRDGRALTIYDTGNDRLGFIEMEDNASLVVGTTAGDITLMPTGNVGIGTTPATRKMEIVAGTAQNGLSVAVDNGQSGINLELKSANPGDSTNMSFQSFRTSDGAQDFGSIGAKDGNLVLSGGGNAASAPHMVIDNSGNVGIGTAPNPSYRLDVTGTARFSSALNQNKVFIQNYGNAYGVAILYQPANDTSAYPALYYNAAGSVVGSILTNSSTTAYNTTSDYRLKENVAPISGALDRVLGLKPSRFSFKSDEAHTMVDGFIAHEVQKVAPYAVTGEKDAVDEDGKPVYQQVDYGKLTPLLTAAIQELKAENDALRARIEALEAKQ